LVSLCAFTLNVIDTGKEYWTELLKLMPEAASEGRRGAATRGTAAMTATARPNKTPRNSDK